MTERTRERAAVQAERRRRCRTQRRVAIARKARRCALAALGRDDPLTAARCHARMAPAIGWKAVSVALSDFARNVRRSARAFADAGARLHRADLAAGVPGSTFIWADTDKAAAPPQSRRERCREQRVRATVRKSARRADAAQMRQILRMPPPPHLRTKYAEIRLVHRMRRRGRVNVWRDRWKRRRRQEQIVLAAERKFRRCAEAAMARGDQAMANRCIARLMVAVGWKVKPADVNAAALLPIMRDER